MVLGNRVAPTFPKGSKIARKYPSLWILILVLPILLALLSISVQNWGQVFDDAFISYRYAQNLAMGHGITWNPGYPPTEGYTNFLLVLILAPAIWAGLDTFIGYPSIKFYLRGRNVCNIVFCSKATLQLHIHNGGHDRFSYFHCSSNGSSMSYRSRDSHLHFLPNGYVPGGGYLHS